MVADNKTSKKAYSRRFRIRTKRDSSQTKLTSAGGESENRKRKAGAELALCSRIAVATGGNSWGGPGERPGGKYGVSSAG